MRKLSLSLLLVCVCAFLAAQNPFLRFPALNSDGSQISFSYQGDIWVVPSSGGNARRITIHEAYESRPQWSLNDQYISFQSNRFGNNDIFVTNENGKKPHRITHYSGSDYHAKWGPDQKLYFNTRRFFAEVEREAEIYSANASGGTPQRTSDALGLSPAPSPDGRFIAFVRGTCREVREAYQGPANRDIWIYNTENKTYTQLTDFEGQDILPDWANNNTLYYLSAENGRYNINRLTLDKSGNVQQKTALTSFTDEGIRYFDISADGQQIVYEKGTSIFKASIDNIQNATKVNISVVEDYRFDPVEMKKMKDGASELALSSDEKQMAFVVHGDIFIRSTDKDKKRTVGISNHPYRDRSPQWLNDSTLLFVSDRNGNNDIFLARSTDSNEASLMNTLKKEVKPILQSTEDEFLILLSPDKSKIAIRKGRGKLVVADIDSLANISNPKTLLNGWATPSNLAWSPDSKWLAYALDDLDFNREIYLQPADNSSQPVNVSLHPRRDFSPVWSADGSKLGFLSNRNNGDADVWFVWLKKEDWEKTKQDWDEEESEEKEEDKKEDDARVDIQIDFEDIHHRLEQVTRQPGNEGNLAISKDGNHFYFSTNGGGGFTSPAGTKEYKSVKWDGSDEKVLFSKKTLRQVNWDKTYKNLFFVDRNGTLSKMAAKGNSPEGLPFNASLNLDYAKEAEQIFEDAWNAIRAGFYDPNFHGQDWAALKAKYKPMALSASTSQDFRAVFNEMLGQINASHMGMYGSDREETQEQSTGHLGVEVVPVKNGVKVTRIVKNSPATRSASELNLGDIITAVNGSLINPQTNFYSLLEGTAKEKILLSVTGNDGKAKELVIRPSSSIRNGLYETWVQQQKDLTAQYSNGRLGYIHIRGMNWTSFERFERELTAAGLGKDGIIIDVRYNGGGWTTDMLMTVLNVRQHAYTVPRGAAKNLETEHQNFQSHYPYGERLPLSAWTKPSIALCNQNSYSNAEIFSHAYKHLGHGTLVGQPTFGAVISTGSHSLMDGSRVRMPFRGWYVKATESNMELGPAVPDIIVENAPDEKAKNQDSQLKKAIATLLQQIDNN